LILSESIDALLVLLPLASRIAHRQIGLPALERVVEGCYTSSR